MFFRTTFAAVLTAATLVSTAAAAADIKVEKPWARASAGMAKAGAAFLSIHNSGAAADRLVGAKADVSKKVELHTHIKESDLMKMRQVEAIDVPAGETVMLQPGGNHVMFMGLNGPFKEGEYFPLTLVFEKAGEVTVDVAVQGAGAKGMEHNQMHDHGGMKGHQHGDMPKSQ